MNHIFTITARNYLSQALTLGKSVSQYHPEARFTICVADGLENIPPEIKNSFNLLDAHDVLSHELFENLSFKYDVTEFCTSFKPAVFNYLFERERDTDLIYYLDPDTRLYNRLDPITDGTPHKTLYLAPHVLDCRVADDNPYPEYHHLWEGIFNLGFCAVRRTAQSTRVLNWWDARLREYCYADYADGLHTDQKWMDYAPALFTEELHVVRHYGVNVSHWNLIERPLVKRESGYFAATDSLIFFHFSGFDFKGDMLNKSVPIERQQVYMTPLMVEFARDYREAVKANGYDRYIQIPYAYNTFDDGTPIAKPHRRLYREFVKHTPVKQPFSSKGTFFIHLREGNLLDRSEAATANYSKATVPNLQHKLHFVGHAMKLCARVLGFRRYAQLVKLFGFLGRFENHHFLIGGRR